MKNLNNVSAPRLVLKKSGEDGAMYKYRRRGKNYSIIASFGGGWDHVSIDGIGITPDWDTMCVIKDIFFDEDEVVIEYHPAKRDYVNIAEHCLHLWRPQNCDIPTPPKAFV